VSYSRATGDSKRLGLDDRLRHTVHHRPASDRLQHAD